MKKFLLSLILASQCISSLAQATSLLPISLQQLSTRATTVFYGVVTDNQVKKDERTGHIATFTTFDILESVKGNIAKTHTIKQIGGHDIRSSMNHHVYGVPRFQAGKEYIVFLPEASSLGFCSPLGLKQGSFMVTSENGEKVVGNNYRKEAKNSIISKSKHADAHDRTQLPLSAYSDNKTRPRLGNFINTVRAYNNP